MNTYTHTHISHYVHAHTNTCMDAHTFDALPLLCVFRCNSKLEKCKADTRSVLNEGWKSCIVKKTDEVEMWTQALCLFLSAINRLKEGMDSQHLCLRLHHSVPVLSVFLESAFARVSLSPLHLCPPQRADAHAHMHKRQTIPHLGPVAQESKQLCSVLAH